MDAPNNSAQLFDSVVGSLKDINPWVTAGITLTLIIWAIFRARSAHFLFDRIWRLIGGGNINHSTLKQDWSDIRDVEGFRFRTGINFPSMEVLLTTLEWAKKHNINIGDLSFSRGWMRERPWIFGTPWMKTITFFAGTALIPLFILLAGSAYFLANDSVLLTIKSSKVSFWTNGSTATDFILERSVPEFSVTLQNCNKLSNPGLTSDDIKVICKTLDTDNAEKIKKNMVEQRLIAAYFMVLLTFILVVILRAVAQAQMANRLRITPPPTANSSDSHTALPSDKQASLAPTLQEEQEVVTPPNAVTPHNS
ncbi:MULTISPECIES: DUF6216 family protein [Pseudomonas]|jgi:hypothetical protein|uniref:DUF6216 family protein n=1 Tax=Pseudomonas migulae TaxID=78543 RepID=A0ABY8MS93_9PSED|nr:MULTISPECIES: DUF6216 family protein [Pseudomonas]EJM88512.1 hypothetical protein PMI33_02666 [Pseudomonas sp. GM67]MBD9549004.1 hypothetical protein [Pseudomonas sp. PDM01]WGK88917.1 DUF6216 family protein [Pseudomonas migulae]